MFSLDGCRRYELADRTVRRRERFVVRGRRSLGQQASRLVDERPELLRARHEVRLAVHLDHDAAPAGGVHVNADGSLARRAPCPLGNLRQSALAQDVDSLFDVALRLGEGGLALHQARARTVAQALHLLCRDCHVLEISDDVYMKTPAAHGAGASRVLPRR
jgi:hypothetical protein